MLLLFFALRFLVELLVDVAAMVLATRVSSVATALLQSRSRKVSGRAATRDCCP
jgi:hypothetical protein